MLKRLLIILLLLAVLGAAGYYTGLLRRGGVVQAIKVLKPGMAVDSLNGVKVYYNGGVDSVHGRNLAADGYNLGLQWQCVEFVKRYYYEYLHHKMPDSYGHAKDFFDKSLADGAVNKRRDLQQCKNGGKYKPAVNDLLVFDGHVLNKYGHVAVVSSVADDEIELIQQNPGPTAPSREKLSLENNGGKWQIKAGRLLGWLRKQ